MKHHGSLVVFISRSLLERLLEASNPGKYKRHSDVTGLLKIPPAELSASHLDRIIEHLAIKELGTDDPKVLAAAIAEAEAELDKENAIKITGQVVGENSDPMPN